MSFVYTETDGAHGSHGEDIEPGDFEPLAEAGTLVHGEDEWFFVAACMAGGGGISWRSDIGVVLATSEETHLGVVV
jgi:hypothetical protein